MANLNGYILTQAGKNLFAKSSSGECKVVFTKAKIGESETTLDELLTKDDLIGTKLKLLDIVSSKAEENKFTIITTVTNSGLEEHFYIRQLGIFAKGLSIDGLNTEILPEKLIAIAYDTNPDVIPAETNNIPYTKQMNIGFSINNADKAEIILSLTGVVTSDVLENHNNDTNAHRSLFKSLFNLTDMTLNSMKSIIQNWSKEVCLPLLGGNMKGNINASGYNITATKFIGNLQGKADSAANADLATKANQDSQGQVINTTYIKSITASNATLTVTKGNGTTSTVTINNVENSKKATQDGSGNTITTHYLSRNQSTQNDMNACTVEGIYRFSGTLKNGWTSDSWGTLLVFNNQYNGSSGVSGTYLVQIALPTDGRMWTRQRVNTGAWTSWNKLANTTDCTDTLKKVYPVGSIYMSTVSTNPATLFGFGTWEAMPAGRVLLAQGKSSWGTTYNAGSTGGEATHKLTVGEMPSHGHTASTDTININGGFRLDGTEVGGTTSASGVFSIGSSFTPSKGHGNSGGGSNAGRNINFNSTHSHKITINNVGEGQSHNNIQPYLTVYMWKRVS